MIDDYLHKGARRKLFEYSQSNRAKETPAEKILWQQLRNRKLKGYKFRRQHPISNFIADFYCAESNLIIELDGAYHNEQEQHQYDEGRTYELKELGLRVIRFTNREVMDEMGAVLEKILIELESSG